MPPNDLAMNPDIQRIAEKLDGVSFEGPSGTRVIEVRFAHKALTELSALRDTQERELREVVCSVREAIRGIVDLGNINEFTKSVLIGCGDLLNEYARGGFKNKIEAVNEMALRAELARRDEQLRQMVEGKTHDDAQHARVIAEISERQAEELRSLREELARRDEVEKELRERVVVGTRITSNGTALTYMGRTAGEWLEIDRAEKELKELREKDAELERAFFQLEEENASLRSMIAELEKVVEDEFGTPE